MTIDTGEIRFEVEEAGDPASERLALCLHGFPELSYSWRNQLPMLARLGFRVWAPNQRGYGRTTRPGGVARYSPDLLVEDVGRLIDASGCRSVTLLGHDWGGGVAWLAVLSEVRPIERLIVLNLPHPTLFQQHVRGWRQLRRSWYMLFFQLPWLPELLLGLGGARAVGEAFRGMAIDKQRFPDEVLDVYKRHALEPGALTAMIDWYRGARHASPRLRRLVERPPVIEIPTLLLWGEEDRALGKELTEGTERYVRDLTVRYLPGVSHWVQQEAPEAVNAMIEAWLAGKPVPQADWGGKLRAST